MNEENVIVQQALFQNTTLENLNNISIQALTVSNSLDVSGATITGLSADQIGNKDVDNTELSLLNGLSGTILTDTNTVNPVYNKTFDSNSFTIAQSTGDPDKKIKFNPALQITNKSIQLLTKDKSAYIIADYFDVSTNATNIANHIADTAAHGATGEVVGTTNTQTLENKTFASPTITGQVTLDRPIINNSDPTSAGYLSMREASLNGSSAVRVVAPDSMAADRTLSLPDADDTLVARETTDTLKNKALDDGSTLVENTTTPTKKMRLDTSSVTAGQTRVMTMADADVDLADIATNTSNIATNSSQIVTNANNLSTHIADTAAHGATGAVVGTTNTQTIQNKTLDSSNVLEGTQLDECHVKNITTAGYLRFYEDPANGSQYIFLGAPASVSSLYTVLLPAADTTLVGQDTTDTLTNKTIEGHNECEMRTSAHQNSLTSAVTKINFDTSIYDNNSMVDTTNKRINVQQAGYYHCRVQLYMTGVVNDEDIRCYVNLSGSYYQLGCVTGHDNSTMYAAAEFMVRCTSDSDYLAFYIWHSDTGGGLNLLATSGYFGTKVTCWQNRSY